MGLDLNDDPCTKLLKFLQGKIDQNDMATVESILEDMQEMADKADRLASDAVHQSDPTTARAVRAIGAMDEARREVAPFVGDVLGQDSAAGIYLSALRQMGQDVAKLHPSAARSMFRALRHQGARPRVAMDAVSQRKYDERFPGVAGLKLR